MMTSIFQELLHKESLANYMDDFIILAKIGEELEKHTIRFLKIAEKHNLCFKWSKCNFSATEIPILGVQVENGKVSRTEFGGTEVGDNRQKLLSVPE